MKQIKSYIIILVSSLLYSCNSLELGAEDFYSINNYWNTPEQCERFMIGLHARVRTQMEDFLVMGELRGGLLNTSSATSVGQGAYNVPIVKNSLTVAEAGISNWGGFYTDIYQINHAIDKISTGCSFLDQTTRNTYLGQLYGIRAYYYFHLLRTWGGVPICDKPDVLITSELDKLDKPRASEQETWQFIRNDVDKSMEAYKGLQYSNFKSKNCYWNKGATVCLMAEVYMWGAKVKPLKGTTVFSANPQADLKAAQTALLEAKSKYSKNTKFADAFSTVNKDANKETIVALRYKVGEATNYFANFTYPASTFTNYCDAAGKPLSDPINTGGGALRYEWTEKFFNSLSNSDTRKRATFYPFYIKTGEEITPAGRFLFKFIGEESNKNRFYTNDYPLYRYMDIVLMLAEICNDLGETNSIKSYIDEVRTRAYGASAPAFSFTNKEAAEEAILAERSIEFVAEGKRWYDIRRMLAGKYALELNSNNELHLVWPINAGVLATDSKVQQNEGYL